MRRFLNLFLGGRGEEEEEEEAQNQEQQAAEAEVEDLGEEGEAGEDERVNGFLRLLNQLRGQREGQEEGEGGDMEGERMEEFFRHLLVRGAPLSQPPNPKSDLNERGYDCAKLGDLEGFQKALQDGADIRYRRDCEKPNMNFGGARKIKTPLHVASCKGNVKIIRYILKECPEATEDISPDLERGALHYACNRKSNVEALEALIVEGKMDVNSKSRGFWTPFHYAVAASRLDMAQFLTKQGADIFGEFEQGGNALTLAACSKNEPLVRWLIDEGVSPNAQDKQGLTPLHRLARYGDLSMVKLLVEYGNADVTLLDNSGCSVMEEADRNNMSEIATYLWTKGCESTSIKNPDGLGPTVWYRLRHIRLPSSRYGTGLAHIGSKLVLFSGLGQDIDYVNHDNENHLEQDHLTGSLKDTYVADFNEITHSTLLPPGVNPLRPDMSLSSVKIGRFIRLDADGLGGWSIPQAQVLGSGAVTGAEDRFSASIVTATRPFKREEKFGYFELHVVTAGEARILTIGLVDENYPINHKQPGWDKDSYGYHGDDGGCFHNNGAGKAWAERFDPGDVIGCGINFEGDGFNKGEVFWTKNGKFLGVSHIGPQKDAYYAAIGVENDGAIFKVNFGKTPFQFSFVVPTMTWKRTQPQEADYATSMGRLVPLPEVNEVLAIPDLLVSLTYKVWLFNMRTLKWRTHICAGVRPIILSASQFVRLGGAVYVWNSKKANDDDRTSMPRRSPALYRLDLEDWDWAELLSYNVLQDDALDDQLSPVHNSDDEDGSDNDSDGEDGDDAAAKKKVAAGQAAQAQNPLNPAAILPQLLPQQQQAHQPAEKHPLRQSNPLKISTPKSSASSTVQSSSDASSTSSPQVLSLTSSLGIATSGNIPVEQQDDASSKMTPKELLSVRMFNVVQLLDGDFNNSFMVAMDNELVFVAHMKMLRVNPISWVHATYDLRGTRPKITHHSAVAVGSDIVTFGGWDDRKQQNELFILDTKACLWYKPHIGGLVFPRARNNHTCIYYESASAPFALDPTDDLESQVLAPHAPSEPAWSHQPRTCASSTSSMAASGALTDTNNKDLVYRFCVFAMGWNGSNTMNDFDIVALDTTKRVEELGLMLDASRFAGTLSDTMSASSSSMVPGEVTIAFDLRLEVENVGEEKMALGAHKAILWARSDYFKALLTEELVGHTESGAGIHTVPMQGVSVEHVKALLKFLYTDHVNVVSLLPDYRSFIKLAEKYAPNHVQRLVAEYLHTKVYEPEKLNEELGELLTSGAFADVTFRVAGQDFKAHKAVLAPRSPFFKALLTGGLAESHQNVIEFEDAAPEEFAALLRFLYARQVDYAHISEYILPLFTLATRCEVRRLKTILESLIAFNLDTSNAPSLLLLAEQLSASSLKRACIDFINREASAIHYEDPSQQEQVTSILKSHSI